MNVFCEQVRVGQKCVTGVEIDPHWHLTDKRVKLAHVIVSTRNIRTTRRWSAPRNRRPEDAARTALSR